jgi:stage IV sporulation protein FB
VSVFFLLILAISAPLGFLKTFLLGYAAALFHEFFHIIAAKILKVSVSRVELLPFGVTARLDPQLIKSPGREILIAAAGPISSFFAAAVFWKLTRAGLCAGAFGEFLVTINLCVGALNLTPILPLDGGRILRAILAVNLGIFRATILVIKMSRIFSIIIMVFAAFLFLIASFNFSLIIICAFLLANLTLEQNFINLTLMKEILAPNRKLPRNAQARAKIIAISENLPAIKLLKYFSQNFFHIFFIISPSGRVLKISTETEIMASLVENGARAKLN